MATASTPKPTAPRILNLHVVKLVWIMLTLSMVLYAVLAGIVTHEVLPSTNSNGYDVVRRSMTFSAGVMVLVSVVLRRFLLGRLRLHVDLENLALPRGDQAKALALAVPALMRRWFFANLVCWVLNEGIVIAGFMVAVVLRDFTVFVPFLVVALVLNVAMWPNLPAYEAAIRRWLEARELRG